MKALFGLGLFLLLPGIAAAHVPILPEFAVYEDYYQITDQALSTAYYGELDDFPHTYVLLLEEPQDIFIEVLVPDSRHAQNNVNGLIVRQLPTGRVEEVASMRATDASWETFYEPFGGDSYRRGGSFEGELPAGSYLVEVSTGNNQGKYVLSMGRLERFAGMGYWETLVRINQVKQFLDKPTIAILQSPLFTVPFVGFLLILFFGYRWYSRRYA